jgi:hypothetical protein
MLPAGKGEELSRDTLMITLNALKKWIQNCLERVLAAGGEVDELIPVALQVYLSSPRRELIVPLRDI